MVRFALGLFLSFTLICIPQIGFAGSCDHDLTGYFQAHEGDTVDSVDTELAKLIPAGSSIQLLGSGKMGGHSYRITEPGGSTYILKQYINFFRLDGLKSDYKLMHALEIVIAKLERLHPRGDHFKVASAQIVSKNVMRLSDTRGVDLEHLLSSTDTRLTPELKTLLKAKYQRYLLDLKKVFAKKEGFEPGFGADLFSVNLAGGRKGEFFLHEANIIVDPETLDLTIIDPY